jgi:replicative DNA helicase
MIISLQVLSRVLLSKDISIIEDNQLTRDYFKGYEEEYDYIVNHYKEYGNVPDILTFKSQPQFADFEIAEISESDEYLIDAIREDWLYNKAVPVVQNIAKYMKTDSNQAVEYMMQAIKDLQPNYKVGGVDIIQNAIARYDAYIDTRDNQDNWFFTTGFKELDDVIHGLNRREELFVIFARTNHGKSWVLEKMCTHVWEIGFNVGYISPEMGALSVGYRFDTLHKNFSNQGLMWGREDFNVDEYKKYVEELKNKPNKFIVATPSEDFNNKITISKLRAFVKEHKLDLLAIDGITYLSDERGKRNDNKTTSLTNISEDLKTLGMELHIPILVVVQANRGGVVDAESDDLPELESIRDSDGISHNATIVLAVRKGPDEVITLQVKKGRGNRIGDKISYQWNPDTGCFLSETGSINTDRPKKKVVEKEDVF